MKKDVINKKNNMSEDWAAFQILWFYDAKRQLEFLKLYTPLKRCRMKKLIKAKKIARAA